MVGESRPTSGQQAATAGAASDVAPTQPLLDLVYCEKCLHHAPMALVPLKIRWDADTSSDRLLQRARCTKCRHKGATLQHPGWAARI